MQKPTWQILQGDALARLGEMAEESINCVVTSPPYWGLRDYGVLGQIGLEHSLQDYMEALREIFAHVHRVLQSDGTLWLNMGDAYAGSWGAQSRGNTNSEISSTLSGASMLAARQIKAGPKMTGKGSLKHTPGLKPKDIIGLPWRLALALQEAGWYLRQDIIWHKPNPMPESVTDRCTKAHEYIFLLTKSPRYYYNAEAIKEPGVYSGSDTGVGFGYGYDTKTKPRYKDSSRLVAGWVTGKGAHSVLKHNTEEGRKAERQRGTLRPNEGLNKKWDSMPRAEQCGSLRNKRSVWTVATHPFPEAHFATFPPELIRPCIKAGCRPGGVVLDPFCGAGTTGMVALQEGFDFIGIELNPDYIAMARRRIEEAAGFLAIEAAV